MTAAKSVVCMSEFKYKKYYGEHEEKNNLNITYSEKKKKDIRRRFEKGYMIMLSNYNK